MCYSRVDVWTHPAFDYFGCLTCNGGILTINLLHIIVARLRVLCRCFTFALPNSVFNACRRLIQQLRLLMNRHDTLIHPPWNLTRIVVWVVAFESKLSTLSIFPWNLTGRSNLRGSAHTLLDLLNLLRLHIDGLVDAFAVLHLLHFISIGDGARLLYLVHTGIALRIGNCVMEVYCVCCD